MPLHSLQSCQIDFLFLCQTLQPTSAGDDVFWNSWPLNTTLELVKAVRVLFLFKHVEFPVCLKRPFEAEKKFISASDHR